jgi:hypothetical protein
LYYWKRKKKAKGENSGVCKVVGAVLRIEKEFVGYGDGCVGCDG